jgi:prepilin-type N-terminal cleavage/methylation domain-containing protein
VTTLRRPRARRARPLAGAPRRGMSLVEVIVAFAIFAVSIVTLARYVAIFGRTVNRVDVQAVASELAADRLETVKAGTNYDTLDSLFAEPTPRAVPSYANYKRQTLFRRVGGGAADLMDYKVVTVVISSPLLRDPIRRTTVVGDL